jgi:hypothetical protein
LKACAHCVRKRVSGAGAPPGPRHLRRAAGREKRSALRSLHEQLREKGMQKDYLALVRGQWQSHVKVVQAPLLKNILQSGERIVRVNQEGKPSETRLKWKSVMSLPRWCAAVR